MRSPSRFFLGNRCARLPAAEPRPRAQEDGLTLVEVIIAFTVLMLVLVPVALLLGNTIDQAASSRERLTALSLAEQYIEILNNTPLAGTRNATPHDANLPATNTTIKQTTTPVVRSTVAYTVRAKFTWTTTHHTNPDLCTSGFVPTLLGLQVTVWWSGTSHHITDTTVIDYPPAGILKDGFLAVRVDGDPPAGPPADANAHAWATRVKAVPVTITPHPTVTGYTTATKYPNEYGCVFIEVPPGAYTVAVADPSTGTPAGSSYGTPSWVASYQEKTSLTKSPFTVTAGQVTTVTFTYDEGSMVSLRYPSTTLAEGDVTCPGVGTILCVVTGQSPTSTSSPTAKPVADLSVLSTSGGSPSWVAHRTTASRLTATACAGTVRCIAVGYQSTGSGYVGASVSAKPSSTSPTFTADSVPAGVTVLDGITCPTSTTCYAIGRGTAGGVILSAAVTTSTVTWTLDGGLSGVSTVSSIVCPAAATCFAIASQSTGPTILSLGLTHTWAPDTFTIAPTTKVAALTQVTCGGPATCIAIGSATGTGGTGSIVLSLSNSIPDTWNEDTAPSVSRLQQVTCPTAAVCYAIGTTSSGVVIMSAATLGATPSWNVDPISGSVSTLTSLQCPTASVCYVAGTKTGLADILSRSTGTTWSADSLPGGVKSISALACPSSTHCVAAGAGTESGNSRGVLLTLKTTSSTTWELDSTPAGLAIAYFSGVACTTSSCEAPGATLTGAVLLSGTPSGTTWTDGTPANLTGLYLADTPISVFNASLQPATTQEVAAPATDATHIGPLFPYSSGYIVAAAECSTEVTATATPAATVPGGTVIATLAMGLLPVEAVTSGGIPLAGAQVTVAPVCTTPLAPPSGTNPTSFTLETTGPLGLSETAVMYGKYTLKVTSGGLSASETVTVTPTATITGGVTRPLPEPLEVTVP